jgi:hypothetical protein
MATNFADLGKPTTDLLSEGFAKQENSFEAEVNANASCGKVSFLVSKKEGGLVSTFKPSHPVAFGSVKGDIKAQLATNGSSKVDLSLNVAALDGLKLKFGASNSGTNGGFDFACSRASTNVKLELPAAGAAKLEAASVVVFGQYSLGARVAHEKGSSSTTLEGKAAFALANNDVLLTLTRDAKTPLALGAFLNYKLNESVSVATKVELLPLAPALGNYAVVVANKVSQDTQLKVRFDSSHKTVGFAVSNVVASNLSLQFGADFRDLSSSGSVYSVKVVYN